MLAQSQLLEIKIILIFHLIPVRLTIISFEIVVYPLVKIELREVVKIKTQFIGIDQSDFCILFNNCVHALVSHILGQIFQQ